ncbi:hypothetical protein [Halobacteriovorax sp. DPLXC-1]|uniref:hypothetical protein n=1 Tax=Halobacteriovorax sp. DPLXC-1 TaxID=3110771 RepID=UPI002FF33241
MILYAPNINSGGGLVLLNTVIEDEVFGKVSTIFVDSRCQLKAEFINLDVIRVKPTVFARLRAELTLKNIVSNTNEEILCFGNLPPLIKHQNKTSVFLQNAYLLQDLPLPKNIKLKIRTIYERFVLYFFNKNTDQIIVQTDWMKKSLEKFCDTKIIVHPFYPNLPSFSEKEGSIREFDLLAITGSEEHKNLDLLITFLERYKSNIKVCIICPEKINISNPKVKLTQYFSLSREEIFKIYQNSKYLITLSKFESLCLPIFEAHHFQTKNIVLNDFFIDDKSVIYKKIEDIFTLRLNQI